MTVLTRFRQGGGLRLVITLVRMGLLLDLLKVGYNVLFRGKRYQEQYVKLVKKVEPLLMKEFGHLLGDNNKPEQKDDTAEGNQCVWFCWLQGMDKAPEMVRACLESQKKWVKDKTFNIITEDNYKEYISLPQFIEEKYAKGIIPNALFSDLIRVELLTKYGGTWIDATVMITGNNYPKEIFDCPLFMPQYISRNGTWAGISNWMITARRGNHLLILLREMLYEYWRRYDCVVDYYIFHLFFSMITRKYPDEVAAMPLLNSFHCVELLKHLGEHDQSDKLQRHLSKVSIHKLSCRLSEEVLEDKENILHELWKNTSTYDTSSIKP